MMIATLLLIANIVSLLWKDAVLFSFWHFLWIYPLEIAIYFIIYGIIILIVSIIAAIIDY